MQRNGLRAMGSPLGGVALGVGFLAQEPPGRPLGLPMWVWILLFVVVIIVAVIWVLREEGQEAARKGEELEGVLEPEPEPAALAVAEAVPPSPEPDELQRIEGIGPKIASVLQENGISTYAQLAETDVGRLGQILEEAKLGGLADPSSWPEQAKLAAAGDWAGLEALQDQLLGGRRVEPDDLQAIEGIGPKIAGVLQAAGINNFAQLAQVDTARLQEILREGGVTQIADPSTWPEQARLAAAGDWEGLETLQDQLKGGRRVDT